MQVVRIPENEGVDSIVMRMDQDDGGKLVLVQQANDVIHIPLSVSQEFINLFTELVKNVI